MIEYIRDANEIYRQSFATVEKEASLTNLPLQMHGVAKRLIHACGMVDIVNDLAFSSNAVEAGLSALSDGCDIYCDVEMVKSGIIQHNLNPECRLVCTLNDQSTRHALETSNNTRSATAVDYWEHLEGSICVIGNAPTALFRLLERIALGHGYPSLIIGIPVGFVGAIESKVELASNSRNYEFITVHGRRGGSAMAAAVVNALIYQAASPL